MPDRRAVLIPAALLWLGFLAGCRGGAEQSPSAQPERPTTRITAAGETTTDSKEKVHSPTPELLVVTPPAYRYSAMMIDEGGVLTAYTLPNPLSPAAELLPWNAENLLPTGRVQRTPLAEWVELRLPGGGLGWVDRFYLTETARMGDLCEDQRLADLITGLRTAVQTQNGSQLEGLVSVPHGLSVTLLRGGRTRIYRHMEAFGIFAAADVETWGFAPGSGLPVMGTFGETVQPDLVAVLDSPFVVYCGSLHTEGASYDAEWPARWRAALPVSIFRPAIIDGGLDWMTWVVGVEFVEGEPRIFSLSRFAWEA